MDLYHNSYGSIPEGLWHRSYPVPYILFFNVFSLVDLGTDTMKKTRIKGHFIPATPLDWIQKAAKLQGNVNATKLALYIWYCQGIKRTRKNLVISSSKAEEVFGVNKWSFSKALEDLIELKMITAVRGVGKSPRVTVICDDIEVVE